MNEELKKELEQFANDVKGGMVSADVFEAKYKALNEKIDTLPGRQKRPRASGCHESARRSHFHYQKRRR